jgi:hypothetical protein
MNWGRRDGEEQIYVRKRTVVMDRDERRGFD